MPFGDCVVRQAWKNALQRMTTPEKTAKTS